MENRRMIGPKDFDKDNIGDEDVTKYGEFISSYFGWTTLEKQKKRANELENITKNEDWQYFEMRI